MGGGRRLGAEDGRQTWAWASACGYSVACKGLTQVNRVCKLCSGSHPPRVLAGTLSPTLLPTCGDLGLGLSWCTHSSSECHQPTLAQWGPVLEPRLSPSHHRAAADLPVDGGHAPCLSTPGLGLQLGHRVSRGGWPHSSKDAWAKEALSLGPSVPSPQPKLDGWSGGGMYGWCLSPLVSQLTLAPGISKVL